jgi:hypothetical protein
VESPILSRELIIFEDRDGTLRLSDYFLVNTELGACVEMRPLSLVDTSNQPNLTATMVNFNKITIMDEGEFFSLTNHGGPGLPFNKT